MRTLILALLGLVIMNHANAAEYLMGYVHAGKELSCDVNNYTQKNIQLVEVSYDWKCDQGPGTKPKYYSDTSPCSGNCFLFPGSAVRFTGGPNVENCKLMGAQCDAFGL